LSLFEQDDRLVQTMIWPLCKYPTSYSQE